MAARAKTKTGGGDGRMLAYSEVSEALGVSRATVSRLVTTGAIGSVRSGPRAVRVPDRALEEFISRGGIPTGGTRKARNREA